MSAIDDLIDGDRIVAAFNGTGFPHDEYRKLIEDAAAELAQMREAITLLRRCGNEPVCPICGSVTSHTEDCELSALLEKLPA